MSRRPTLRDVARESGFSLATVNRVVGGVPGVREDTARKIADAAARVGYHGRNLMNLRATQALPEIRMGFVLHKEKQAFYQNFARNIRAACESAVHFRVRPKIHFVASQAPSDFAHDIVETAKGVDIIAATAVNHHAVTDAVSDLERQGIGTIALLSDFAQGVRKSYVGLNNLKIGRGAAHALTATSRKPGKIALFVGGNRWHGHELRETGFRSHFRESAQGYEVLDTYLNLETRQLTYEASLQMIEKHPDLVGMYLAGGGMEGAISALREEKQPGEVSLVVNEWTPDSRSALEDGYVTLIAGTPLERLCRELVDMMATCVLKSETPVPSQVFLDPELYLPEFF